MLNSAAQNVPTSVLPPISGSTLTRVPQNSQLPIRQDSDAVPTTSPLTLQLGDKQDLKTLGEKLQKIATQLGADATPEAVLNALNSTPMALHPASSHPKGSNARVTVAAFIQHQGLPLPTDHFSLTALAQAVTSRALVHPLGNLGGALSWPVPLSSDEQRRLRSIAMSHAHHLGEQPLVMQTKGGLLPFLGLGIDFPAQTLRDPAKLLDALLTSAQAQLMGKALQERLQGIATPSSSSDYLLAAITLQLDPESITAPRRNTIAGFDLAGPENLGRPASAVLERFVQHLISQNKTSPAMAGAAAHLLLSGRAPAFLVKDIPSGVTYGSPAWLNFAVAAATIEAQTPGKVASMTFAQVMLEARSAALVDLAVTEAAQKAALLDWGAANGVVAKKDDSLYTTEDLKTLIEAFNARNTLMANAAKALDTELPSRREMALAQLKQRFPGKEALFEEKVISVTTSHTTHAEGGRGVGYGKLLTGLHSMLDIAMMNLKHPNLVFHSHDARIPIAQMNADADFGINDEFEQQFSKGIGDQKSAAGTVIKHLIAQLPLEDRKNFEYGDVSFFQNTSLQLGAGFTDKTQLPPGKELLVSITRNGVTSAYEINFDKGAITHVPNWQATEQESRTARVVHQTRAFEASDSAALKERPTPALTQTVPDSFVSSRTQVIADTFVKHLNLDAPEIKAQARGITTEDRRLGLADQVGDFLLNLIPFRSAVVNFQKGNYGEGAFDLALDVFGFLTAGAGTIGKAVKIGTSAASAVTKAFKVAKVIGAATISALNPLDGLGDLAVGGVRLAGSGVKFLHGKVSKGINKLRGATGSYDLLKAVRHEHGPTLIGTYKAGEDTINTSAVLRNDHWYRYDPIRNQVFGLPIPDFKPIGAPGSFVVAGTHNNFGALRANMLRAQTPANIANYNKGYSQGIATNIPGYRADMGPDELRALASKPTLTAEQVGVLIRELKDVEIQHARYASALLLADVQAPGVTVIPMSQIHYLAHVDLASKGECAGLSNLMALAVHQGKEQTLMQNFYRAAANPAAPDAENFIQALKNLQRVVGSKDEFHMGKIAVKKTPAEIINELLSSPTSKTLRIGSKDHGMIAGIRVKAGKPEWFFYEPNSGMATFNTLKSMQDGLENVLDTGQIATTLNTYGSKRGAREYNVSEFDVSDMNKSNVYLPEVQEMLDNVL